MKRPPFFMKSVLVGCLLATLAVTTVWAQPVSGKGEREGTTLKLHGTTMGPIEFHVVIAHVPESTDADQIQKAIDATLDRIDRQMSTYRADSDIARFNQTRSTDWQSVDRETAQVVAQSLKMSRLTEGAFDVTVGPAVNLWNFGTDKKKLFRLPTDDQVAEVKKKIGFRLLDVRLDPPAIKKSNPDVKIDLSAIAKGHSVDQVALTLKGLGFHDFMIEVGGEVVALGTRSSGDKWRIGIELPNDRWERAIGRVAELSGSAMATSGDYRQFRKIEGKRISHTIDPVTARPVEHTLATACVIAPDCATADAMATAFMVLGIEKGKAVCQKNRWAWFAIERESDFGSKLTEKFSDDFPFFEPDGTKERARLVEADPEAASDPDSAPATANQLWPMVIGALVVFLLAVAGMAIGAMFGRKPIQGSCGGLASMAKGDCNSACELCRKKNRSKPPANDATQETIEA